MCNFLFCILIDCFVLRFSGKLYVVDALMIFISREKRKEKERENLWKRLATVELNPSKDKDPCVLSKTPLTDFTAKRELSGGYGMVAPTNPVGDKSPNFNKRRVNFHG